MFSIKGQKLYDAHLHCHGDVLYTEGLENFKERMEGKSIAGGTLLSFVVDEHAPGDCAIDNISCLYYKQKLPGIYTAFAGCPDYTPDDPEYYLNYAKKSVEMGFDGFKSLLQLPNIRKRVGKGINHPCFAKFFDFLEENDIPFVLHAGNPDIYWDPDRVPESAKRLGRFFDETFLTLEELYQETFDVLDKHPKLRITLAHGLFMGGNPERLTGLMEKYPNMTIDLTPNVPFYADATEKIEEWKVFFKKYQKRVYFGTDTYVPAKTMSLVQSEVVCAFLETPGPFKTYLGDVIAGIDIDGEQLHDICWENAVQRVTPKPLNRAMIVEECRRMLREEDAKLKGHDKENLEIAIREFSK